MGTRSRIGMEVLGQIKSVYCHNDGYLDGVGLVLLRHYSDDAKIAELIALGDLSSVGETTATPDTEAYSRDRGEELRVTRSKSVDTFLKAARQGDAEFIYLRTGGAWKVWYDMGYGKVACEEDAKDLTLELVTEALES